MASSLSQDERPGRPSLADIGFEALSLFQRVQTDETPADWPAVSFANEAERFELWVINLGVFVLGHGSLDYRVREADSLAQTIIELHGSAERAEEIARVVEHVRGLPEAQVEASLDAHADTR